MHFKDYFIVVIKHFDFPKSTLENVLFTNNVP